MRCCPAGARRRNRRRPAGRRRTRHRLELPRLRAGHGDEPVEIQALVTAGRGVTLTHELTVIVSRNNLVVLPLTAETGVRHVSVAYPAGPMTTATETVLTILTTVGEHHRPHR
jgi:hypothetical protein